MSYKIITTNLSPIELAEYLETAPIGTIIRTSIATYDGEYATVKTDKDIWSIQNESGVKCFYTTLELCMMNETMNITLEDEIKLTHHCIHIGYTGNILNTVWPIVNPWEEELRGISGKQFIPISYDEFSKKFLPVLNECEDGGGILDATIILNIHPSVNATQVMWSIKALKNIGIRNIEIRSAENGSMRYSIV